MQLWLSDFNYIFGFFQCGNDGAHRDAPSKQSRHQGLSNPGCSSSAQSKAHIYLNQWRWLVQAFCLVVQCNKWSMLIRRKKPVRSCSVNMVGIVNVRVSQNLGRAAPGTSLRWFLHACRYSSYTIFLQWRNDLFNRRRTIAKRISPYFTGNSISSSVQSRYITVSFIHVVPICLTLPNLACKMALWAHHAIFKQGVQWTMKPGKEAQALCFVRQKHVSYSFIAALIVLHEVDCVCHFIYYEKHSGSSGGTSTADTMRSGFSDNRTIHYATYGERLQLPPLPNQQDQATPCPSQRCSWMRPMANHRHQAMRQGEARACSSSWFKLRP